MEFNHMEELGFVQEKQFVTSCNGIISRNDYARDLCARTIRNGERFFDALSRYEDLTSYIVADRDESKNVPTMKMILPFLKSYGITDHMAYTFAKEDLKLVPGTKGTMGYLNSLLPSFVNTGSLEHHMMAVGDNIDIPETNFTFTKVEFDLFEADRLEARRLRDIANTISSLKISKRQYSLAEEETIDDDDENLIQMLDGIFLEDLPKTDIWKVYKDVKSIGFSEKTRSLLEIRRKTEIDLCSTVYAGNGINDSQSMEAVKESGGLAISFNGSEYAVRASNVAVMSSNNIVLALLTSEFYNEGIEAVYDMIENWDRDKLQSHKCSDRNLMNMFLRTFPKKLPTVRKIDRWNVDEVVKESEEYGKKLSKCRIV